MPQQLNNKLDKTAYSKGFTIVELLIVVVVIAILAAIAIVSYSGITAQAEEAAMKSALRSASNKVSVERMQNSSYPDSLDEVGIDDETDIYSLQYSSEASSFCITAFSVKNPSKSFYISSMNGNIAEGRCDGHGSAPETAAACFAFDSGTGVITDYYDHEGNNSGNPACPRDVGIPSQIGGVDVASIGYGSFSTNQLTSVTIPNSVTNIDGYAFQHNQLTSVNIPNSVTTIALAAFYGNQLTSVNIPNSVTTIGSWAFRSNQLTSVTISNSATSIGSYAFQNNQLTSVTIPDSVTTIGANAFQSNQLTSVTISNSATSIGSYAFQNNQLTSVTIPSSITSIEEGVFWSNQLTSVIIPNLVTEIGDRAFENNQLGNVSLPSHLSSHQSIPGAAFSGNPSLTFAIRP